MSALPTFSDIRFYRINENCSSNELQTDEVHEPNINLAVINFIIQSLKRVDQSESHPLHHRYRCLFVIVVVVVVVIVVIICCS